MDVRNPLIHHHESLLYINLHLTHDTNSVSQLEALIQLAASLPPDSTACKTLSRYLIEPLWNGLHHPPLCYLGDEYKYRKSDGSNNNVMNPRLGAAGSRYARTVTPKTLAPSIRPDAGLVFDTLFARGDEAELHPTKVSSFLFYLAIIITHGED
jgi:hypothetical protein